MQLPQNLDALIKALSVLGAVSVFIWGVIQFIVSQHAQAETRRIEATKPFLERQLQLYTNVTQVAAGLATSHDVNEVESATKRFWSLYWGELALVEDKRVEAAMADMKRALEAGAKGEELTVLSLALARACRDSLAESWGVKEWRNPDGQVSK